MVLRSLSFLYKLLTQKIDIFLNEKHCRTEELVYLEKEYGTGEGVKISTVHAYIPIGRPLILTQLNILAVNLY